MPERDVKRIVELAGLLDWQQRRKISRRSVGFRCPSQSSCYGELHGISFRVSNHVRRKGHLANLIHDDADYQIIVVEPDEAPDLQLELTEARRRRDITGDPILLVRKTRERSASTAVALRKVIATIIKREMKDRQRPEWSNSERANLHEARIQKARAAARIERERSSEFQKSWARVESELGPGYTSFDAKLLLHLVSEGTEKDAALIIMEAERARTKAYRDLLDEVEAAGIVWHKAETVAEIMAGGDKAEILRRRKTESDIKEARRWGLK